MPIESQALEQYIKESGVSYKQNSNSFIFDCPRCGKKDKLYIRRSDGRFTCWVCAETEGFFGSAEYALSEILSLPVTEIRPNIGITNYTPRAVSAIHFHLKNPYGEIEVIDDREVVEFDSNFVPIAHPDARDGQRYLSSRQVPIEIASEYQIHYNPRNGRIIIPVIENGKLYGWQARATRGLEWVDKQTGEHRKAPKITSLKTMTKGRHIMFHDRLIGSDHAILCEGPFDALQCHLAGGNVATMGKQVSQEQINLIRSSGVKKIYLALDPDAKSEINALIPKFSDLEIYTLLPPKGFKDLGECSMEQVLECFMNAPRITLGHIQIPELGPKKLR